ncbi:MAG: SPOR domain-containing protein [Spirochaetaceae bacterium]|jgi:hypothetical protein|nr:SPOR domain-containing protein [Spirochaetaceae bacterium]
MRTVPLGSIKTSLLPALALGGILFLGPTLPAQNTRDPGGSSLGAEIQNIEGQLKDPALSGTARHGILLRLARLFGLSGNIEGAAQAWTGAAFAEQGKRDDAALIEGAACLIAMGELDRAEAAVKTVLLTGRERRGLLRARYMGAHIEAFRSGDYRLLTALLDDPEYGELKPAIYYNLWKFFGVESCKTRLLAEFPASPEARIIQDGRRVSAAPAAMWLLFPGRAGVTLENSGPPPADSGPSPAGPPVPQPSAASREPAGPGEGPRAIQTGLFRGEENARAMADRLRAAGFTAIISPRIVGGAAYWMVGVPPGADANMTVLRLRDAGFESFPVF